MKLDRALAAAALLLASGAPHAYQIVEGRYRVETSPGVFQDLLVVRCDDGRTLTVPWETKLAEACNEGLMGERLSKGAGKPQAPVVTAAAAPVADAAKPGPDAVNPEPAVPASTQSDAAPALLMDDQAQKEAMLAQVRAQFGNLPEQYIEFKPGAAGLSMRFLPPLSDIVKKYEACRRARDLSADCGGERDRALAKLTNTAAAPQSVTARPDKPQAAAPKSRPAAPESPPSSAAAAAPAALPEPAQPAVQAPAPATPDRAATQQKIGEDFASCMRAKPKFECEQARAKALGELDRPKNGKAKRPAKQAATASGKVAAAQ